MSLSLKLDTAVKSINTYEIIKGLDKNVRDISSELYVFRREHNRDIADIKQELEALKASSAKHDKNIDRLQEVPTKNSRNYTIIQHKKRNKT